LRQVVGQKAWAGVLLALAVAASGCQGNDLSPRPTGGAGPSSSTTSRPVVGGTSGDSSTLPDASIAAASSDIERTGPTGKTTKAKVVRIVDGDTIVVAYGGKQYKVRYIGMDTPETVDPNSPVEWMGPQASAANSKLVAGKDVVLEKDVSEVDQYGRLLRYVWLKPAGKWLLVNLELVRRGFASVATFPPDVKYVDVYRAAERVARAAGVGLWGPTPQP
jgi:micrococcal nuclease